LAIFVKKWNLKKWDPIALFHVEYFKDSTKHSKYVEFLEESTFL
jgi:hypothetical protein